MGRNTSKRDYFGSLAEAADAYARCRNTQYFRLTDDAPERAVLHCGTCGKLLDDERGTPPGYRGTSCKYVPRTGRFVVQHYTCAWDSLLGATGTSYSLAEAAAKLAAAERMAEVAS
jgi:hypothetical protein